VAVTARPQSTEFAEYYGKYIARVPDGDIVAILRAQMEETSAILDRVGSDRVQYRYAPDKWTLHEVVGHVVDMEWVFTARALCFARGLAEPMPGVEQDDFVKIAKSTHQPWANLLAQWRGLREANTLLFDSFDDAAWTRTGIASGYSVSVRALAYIIAGHERHHMGIIRERYL
jgi:hypothetical protein